MPGKGSSKPPKPSIPKSPKLPRPTHGSISPEVKKAAKEGSKGSWNAGVKW